MSRAFCAKVRAHKTRPGNPRLKRSALAAFLLSAAATASWAQSSGVPEQKCEPKPVYPGLKNLKSDVEVKAFEAQIASYKKCIQAYIDDRQAAAQAHRAASAAAADEHNKVMQKIATDQEASRADAEKARAADKKDNVNNPGATKK